MALFSRSDYLFPDVKDSQVSRSAISTAPAELDVLPSAQPQRLAGPPGQRQLAGRLAGLTLGQQVFVLAIWPFCEQLLGFLVGFVDTALAGHLSVAATNAIGVASFVAWLLGLVQAAVGTGATALVARAIGARHRRLANAALGQAMTLALFVGVAAGGGVMLAAPLIGSFTGLEGENLALCTLYLRIIALAAPFSAILFIGAACLRAAGDTRTPFWVLVAVNLVNTTLSVTFVAGPPPLGGHGVAGIAGGTFFAWLGGAVLTLWVLLRAGNPIRLYRHRLRPHWHTARRILAVGLPSAGETLFGLWLPNFLVLRIVGLLGEPAAWGAHVVAVRTEALSFMPGFAMGIAAATLAGQYLGLGDPSRARRAVLLCWKISLLIMGSLGLFFIIAPWLLVRIVTNEPALLAASPPLLRLAGLVQVFFATAIVLGQGMRGAGDTRTTMWMTTASCYLVRLPLAWLFGLTLGLGLTGVWIGLCAELACRGLLFAARFFHGGWLKVHV